MLVDLPTPPTIPGLSWRVPAKEDAAAIVALQDACFGVDGGFREVESEILERWDSDYNVVEDDALLAVDRSGGVVATTWSYVPTIAATKWRAFADIFVHPDHRDPKILEFVHEWWETRSLQRFDEKEDGLERWLWRGVYDWQCDKIEFLVNHGYEPTRYFDELARDLSNPIEPMPLADGLTFATWESAPLEDSRSVHNESFADHWGSQPVSKQSWAQGFNEFSIPEASFVVYDAQKPVAYLAAAAYPHDFEDKGRTEAWIEGLGTLRSHRKRGIASSLVTFAMSSFRDSGLEFAALGVDSDNPTGAFKIYEALGFVRDRRNIAYIKKV